MSSIFYVYRHIDPITNEVVYIGKGTGGRAWDTSRTRKNSHREHFDWMMSLQLLGYTPQDWVEILGTGYEEAEAFEKEKKLMHQNGQPKFNRTCGEKNHKSKLTDQQAREVFTRCKDGDNHSLLAKEYNVSRSAISMIASRKQWRAATACLILTTH